MTKDAETQAALHALDTVFDAVRELARAALAGNAVRGKLAAERALGLLQAGRARAGACDLGYRIADCESAMETILARAPQHGELPRERRARCATVELMATRGQLSKAQVLAANCIAMTIELRTAKGAGVVDPERVGGGGVGGAELKLVGALDDEQDLERDWAAWRSRISAEAMGVVVAVVQDGLSCTQVAARAGRRKASVLRDFKDALTAYVGVAGLDKLDAHAARGQAGRGRQRAA